jgi:hypothetical protein
MHTTTATTIANATELRLADLAPRRSERRTSHRDEFGPVRGRDLLAARHDVVDANALLGRSTAWELCD